MAVDTILRYETLADDFADLMKRRDLDNIDLPWRGRSDRQRSYRDYFNPAARQRIELAFGDDLEAFSYSF